MQVWVAQIPFVKLTTVSTGAGMLAAGVLLIRIGQGAYAVGLSRARNSASVSMRGLCDLCVASLAFWALGAAILFHGGSRFFGVETGLLFGASIGRGGTASAILLGAIVASIATGAVVEAAAERSRFFPLVAASVLLAAIVVPVAGNWATSGWLARLGFVDPAGASWVHLTGGVCAAVAAWAIGPRQGKYNRDGSVSMMPGHSLPLARIGAMLMLAGWLPYVGAMVAISTGAGPAANADMACLNVLVAAAAAGLTGLLYSQVRYGKPDVGHTLMGMLGGLVAISAAAGVVASYWAVLIGAVAGCLVPLASIWIDRYARVDDPVGAVAIHGVGGLWGTLAAGIFAAGSLADHARHVGVQLLGTLAIAALSAAGSLALFLTLRSMVQLRVSELDEFDGLDLAQHDIAAYPDFQQNTIRSYHMREA
jgi:Amt family ammonium transporter